MRVALYARVSTDDQHAENQLLELRRYVAARGWAAGDEFLDEGISGAKTRRPGLDRLMLAARRRQIDAVVCWRPAPRSVGEDRQQRADGAEHDAEEGR
jgi:DNA invertase Pin-like site-specific DNA recombinase